MEPVNMWFTKVVMKEKEAEHYHDLKKNQAY